MKLPRKAIIILAAGASTRMGRPKQLLAWGSGNLLQHTISQSKNTDADDVLVVIGANASAIREVIPNDVITINNPDYKSGMGSSIAAGVNYVQNSKDRYTSVLILLADQPFIDTNQINKMYTAMARTGMSIVATSYDGVAGVPALFSSDFFSALVSLSEEFGAKALLAKFSKAYFHYRCYRRKK